MSADQCTPSKVAKTPRDRTRSACRTVRIELHVAQQRLGGILVRDDVHRERALCVSCFSSDASITQLSPPLSERYTRIREHIKQRRPVRIDEEPARCPALRAHAGGSRGQGRGEDDRWRRRHDLLPRRHTLRPLPQEHLTRGSEVKLPRTTSPK
jgi:hypothetical protein